MKLELEQWWNDTDGSAAVCGKETVSLSFYPPQSPNGLGLNLGFWGDRLVTNCFSHGTAIGLQAYGFNNHKPWHSLIRYSFHPLSLLLVGYQWYPSWSMKPTTHLPPLPRLGKVWSYPSTPPYAFMAGCFMYCGNFTCVIYVPFSHFLRKDDLTKLCCFPTRNMVDTRKFWDRTRNGATLIYGLEIMLVNLKKY